MKAAIVMGSDSDLSVMKETIDTLKKFGIGSYVSVTSAHRTPDKVKKFLAEADRQGCEVIIAAAGLAAHLGGVIAAHTTLPVIGVPMQGGALNGVDALYSIVQMPAGIPVACMAIGRAGAVNAGVFAAQILSVKYPKLKKALGAYKKELASGVEQKDKELQTLGVDKYLQTAKKSI
ncbi:MAG: 5-(carboxyamino)imidazole ribonucleotide mutase [Spirochaetia bacterium]|nr:5-(carboxyamino)imidazole ribonucleotide mutase [Spirochaetia bacterium]